MLSEVCNELAQTGMIGTNVKKYWLSAAAIIAIAAPASARDGNWYVGAEAGAINIQDSNVDRRFPGGDWVPWLDVDHDLGYDVDLVLGYDLGIFRLEGELGYKRAKHNEYEIDNNAPGPFPGGGDEPVFPGAEIDADGRTSILSGMVNALFDVGGNGGVGFYAGAGAGIARVSMTVDQLGTAKYHLKDTGFAWQLIAGLRVPVSNSLDAGLKYRYFNVSNLKGDLFDVGFDGRTDVRSHSLLATLAYNFGARDQVPPPPLPPPPAPPPPATQTCPDGSVIMASDICPPPPPPPPPPPEPERG